MASSQLLPRAGLLAALAMLLVVGGCASSTDGAASATRVDGANSAASADADVAAPASELSAGSAPTALIVDASGSMLVEDAPGQRMAAAKSAAITLVETLPDGSRLALLTYGTGTGNSAEEFDAGCRDVTVLSELADLDAGAVEGEIETLVPSGYTPIGAALQKAAEQLPDSGPAAIVLVSDGEDMCSPPPCEVAASLKAANPELAISAVGFRADGLAADQLSCIANATGGIFVTADNAPQLSARLSAAADLTTAREALTATGRDGVEIGEYHDEIAARTMDFPAFSAGERSTVDGQDRIVIVWRNCDWIFTSAGELVEIAPGESARTIDGIARGTKVSAATELLGPPITPTGEPVAVPEAGSTLLFPADERAGTAWRVGVDGSGDEAVVKTIVLCLCLPGSAADIPNQVSEVPSGTLLSSGEIETSGVCGPLCDVRGFADVDHPRWGKTRVFMTEVRGQVERDGGGANTYALMAIDTDGRVRWRFDLPGDVQAGKAMKPVKDTSGNVFFETTQGGGESPIVLRPTMRGFEHFGTLAEDGGSRFFGYTRQLGDGGVFEFRPTRGGTVYSWNGSTYAPK